MSLNTLFLDRRVFSEIFPVRGHAVGTEKKRLNKIQCEICCNQLSCTPFFDNKKSTDSNMHDPVE